MAAQERMTERDPELFNVPGLTSWRLFFGLYAVGYFLYLGLHMYWGARDGVEPYLGFLAWHAIEPALIVIAPVVIKTLECFGIALGLPAHGSTTMTATVVENSDLTIVTARDQEGSAADFARYELAMPRQLAFVASVKPSASEKAALLFRE